MARVVVVLCAVAFGGCAAFRPDRPTAPAVVAYRPGGPVAVAAVQAPAVYDLVRADTGAVVVTRYLGPEVGVGFDRDGYGQARAAAGDERWPVADAPHEWRVSPATARLERDRKVKEVTVAANRAVDDGAQVVGRVCYPPLWVAAWPAGVLRGGALVPGDTGR
ncbi:MAG: hypothetical protein K2X87_34765 [Gemmataceae bacterium]|nr:hypothetical protein [Gemmataceae bacterium]